MPEPETNNQYRSLQEIESKLASVRSELAVIDQIQEPTEEDISYQGTLIEQYDDLETKAGPLRQRMEKLEAIRKAASQPGNSEEPAGGGVKESVRAGQAPTMFVRSNLDPFADLERVERNMILPDELRARAEVMLQEDENRKEIGREAADVAHARAHAMGIGGSRGGVAKHMLLTGSQAYREAFRSYLEDPLSAQPGTLLSMTEDGRYRAINLTNASGGFLLPYVLDPSIVLTNNASANPFRRVSRVVQTTSNAWQGVSSAGVNAAIIAEATTAADGAPSDFAQIQIKPVKAAVWVLGSYEALDDTDFGTQLPGLLADGKDRLESAQFATGSGTNAPLGIESAMTTATRVAPTTTGTAFNGTAAIPDIGNLMAALPPRFRRSPRAAFMGNIVQLNKVRSMDQYGGGGFWANLTSDTPPSLYGSPVYEGSDLNSGTTGTSSASGTGSSTLFFGDWDQFIIVDRVGFSMLYDPLIKGTGASAQLPQGQAGWYGFWRFSSAISTTAGFRNLTIS